MLVHYEVRDAFAMVTMDDGKANVMSLQMQAELHAALNRAAVERPVVVLTGRPGMFSAGFDLQVLRSGGPAATDMVVGGFELARRLLAFPTPVVVAATGHAVAMGLFLLLSGDYRIGAAGPFKLTPNEVAIGLPMPYAATEILRQRLTPAAFNRAVTIAEVFSPDNAVCAGILDEVVGADRLTAAIEGAATRMAALDLKAHAVSKLRARAHALDAIRRGIELDLAQLRGPQNRQEGRTP